MSDEPRFLVIALAADGNPSIPRILRAAFRHPWVAGYQIGFGPPLVRATPAVVERLKSARDALDKLDAYLECCVLDPVESARLSVLQRKLIVRRSGPVEAEALDAASQEALDLSLRLFSPASAPLDVRSSMLDAGIGPDLVPLDCSPERLTGRFVLHLHDPKNERLLHVPEVLAAVGGGDGVNALELRVPAATHRLWCAFVEILAQIAPFRPVEVGSPTSHARVITDGERR